ncbi:MAG: zinc metallopeptidase [Lachnospiraceae bacterium]|nr:zinc metallopeptidase [Lachnospiraceae bacterium]
MRFGYGFYPYIDPTYMLVIIGALLCMAASANVNMTFSRYSRNSTRSGITGQEAARRILMHAGITDVRIERIGGSLTDHFDPRNRVVRLSDSVYNSTSVAAIGVAAHECGHVIQHSTGYLPIKIRSAIVPVVNIGSRLSLPIILLGIILSSFDLVNIGIILFGLTFAFQLVTLPVEFNASHRALKILESDGMMYDDELRGARKVLKAAALTYITAAVSTLLQLLRLVLLFGRRSDD